MTNEQLEAVNTTLIDAEHCKCNNKGAHYRKHEMLIPAMIDEIERLKGELGNCIGELNLINSRLYDVSNGKEGK